MITQGATNPDAFDELLDGYRRAINTYLAQVDEIFQEDSDAEIETLADFERRLFKAHKSLEKALLPELFDSVKATHGALKESLDTFLAVQQLAERLRAHFDAQLAAQPPLHGPQSVAGDEDAVQEAKDALSHLEASLQLSSYVLFVNSVRVLVIDLTVKLTKLWQKSNEVVLSRAQQPLSLRRLRLRRLIQFWAYLLGFVSLGIAVLGLPTWVFGSLPYIKITEHFTDVMGFLGLLWFPVDRYVLEPHQLQYVKIRKRLIREAEQEARRLKNEIHTLRQYRNESTRLACLWPVWVEQRLGDLDRGVRPSPHSIDNETKKIDLIATQV
jgi:hypothetical protein